MLRNYILLLFLAVCVKAFTQAESDNFYLFEEKITWKKVYETTKSKAELIDYFKNSGLFWTTETIADTIYGKLKLQKIDPAKTGVAGVPELVNKTGIKGNVKIELKDKKYRILFTEILMVGNGEILKKGEEQSLEYNFLNKELTAYRPGFLKKPSWVYNTTFSELFEIKTKAKDEW